MDTNSLIERLLIALGPFESVRFAWLFGSRARGTARIGSDVDVGVYLDRDRPVDDLLGLADALCRACGRDDVQVVVLNHRGPAFLINVLVDGILLVERDREARIEWQARTMSEWYDFAPTWYLWRETFWEARRKEALDAQAAGR